MNQRAARLAYPVLLSIALSGAIAAGPAAARPGPLPAPRPGLDVPEALRPWVPWVLHGKEEALCPFLHGENGDGAARCAWPSSLVLSLGDRGGRFTQQWRVYKRQWVALPGEVKLWPQEVRVNGKPAVVAAPKGDDDDAQAAPAVFLEPGDHTVTGAFLWDDLPESLAVPTDTGLLSLTVRGARLLLPSRDEHGRVWLHKGATQVEADVLDMTVHRQVTDDIPLLLTTRIELRAAGRSREVVLGKALPAGFVPLSLEGRLPARLEPDGHLRVQVRPGTWELVLAARHDGPVGALSRPAPEGTWAAGEVWVFDARPALRLVTVEGVSAIDPQQTTLPDEWKRLPCYPMGPGDTLKLVERRRGDTNPAPDRLSLHRELWLDFDGGGYTVSDRISGTARRAWRLEVNPPTELGRVSVDGKDQFITRSRTAGAGGAGGALLPGVEIRQGTLNVSADSRIPRRGDIPAVSWNSDFHEVDGVLHLPPGWRLLHASGADDVPDTWIHKWTLLDLFLVLIISMAIGRLFGAAWGGLGLLTLIFIFPESEAPRWAWLAVLAAEALGRVLPPGRLLSVVRLARLLSRVTLVLLAVSFAAQQVRHGLYPALEHPDQIAGDTAVSDGRFARFLVKPDEKAVDLPPAAPAAGSAGAVADEDGEKEEKSGGKSEVTASLLKEAPKKTPIARPEVQYNTRRAYEYDPNAMVQTGPGLPRWRWNTAALRFSGPVDSGQRLRLWLVPPSGNLLLGLLQVGLLGLLVVRLLGLPVRLPGPARRRAAALLPLLVLLGGTREARAELPQQPLLDELRTRLLEQPTCRPHCASSPRLSLEVLPRVLRARMEVGAAAPTAVPLPGGVSQWVPERVLLDGRPAPAMLRTGDGRLWLELPEGSHQVLLEGPLPNRETVQISLPLKSHRVEARVEGWLLEGLHEDGLADGDLQLTRAEKNRDEGQGSLQPGALPPFVRVEREVQIGLLWQVDTKVTRVTPTGSAVVVEVPLLPGESITTPDVRVHNGKALVNMGPSATEASWHSLLQERSPMVLAAPRGLPWTEVWRLDVSPIWHVEPTGIPVVHQQDEAGLRRPEWRPWPGEEVRIQVTRPEGIAGRTLTIDRSVLTVQPGLRSTEATLSADLRSSRGGQHILTLPEGAQLLSVSIDDKTQPIRQDGRKVTLPLLPGRHGVQLTWRQRDGVALRFLSPEVDLGAASVNAEVRIQLGEDRWTLWCWGPRLGPAVLFWSFLLVLCLVSVGLGQVRFVPLRTQDWLLLFVGLSQVPLPATAAFAVWLLLLGWRKEHPDLQGRWRFNLRQLLLGAWTLAALGILVGAIREGLLGRPDMQISGNGSSNLLLRWFADRVGAVMPRAYVLSVPLWVYRVAMLLWALWIAASLLRWLRWGWAAFSAGSMWRPRPPKAAPPPPPAAPAAG